MCYCGLFSRSVLCQECHTVVSLILKSIVCDILAERDYITFGWCYCNVCLSSVCNVRAPGRFRVGTRWPNHPGMARFVLELTHGARRSSFCLGNVKIDQPGTGASEAGAGGPAPHFEVRGDTYYVWPPLFDTIKVIACVPYLQFDWFLALLWPFWDFFCCVAVAAALKAVLCNSVTF